MKLNDLVEKVKEVNMLDGYRTYIAAIASILSGIGMIAKGVTDTPFSWELVNQGWVMVVAGLAVFGLGKKLSKLTDATKGGN